ATRRPVDILHLARRLPADPQSIRASHRLDAWAIVSKRKQPNHCQYKKKNQFNKPMGPLAAIASDGCDCSRSAVLRKLGSRQSAEPVKLAMGVQHNPSELVGPASCQLQAEGSTQLQLHPSLQLGPSPQADTFVHE
ncbi:MAG: hypothetical protein P4M11_00965, partial [Candidatus Pacebacteria bacterium]|nr:hypothetical protein [Candidatus Paceibacterota bacterium]